MVAFNKRLAFWLFKAYLRKWGKIIVISFFAGLVVFFTLLSTSRFLLRLIPLEKKASIGYVGAYRIETLPEAIASKLSRGLTKIEKDGSTSPDVASGWEIKNDGKTYVFSLRDNVEYSNGEEVTAKNLPYEFRGVKKDVIDENTISYTLQEQYSPFLVTVSRPIISTGFVGLGDYTIQDVELNGDFIQTLTIVSRKNKFLVERYSFYPSEAALKTAFALGEINRAVGLSNDNFLKTELSSFKNTSVTKEINPDVLVTLFFHVKDPLLSDQKLRSGLTYALPESFALGQRAFLPFPPLSKFTSTEGLEKHQDISHATVLIDSARESASTSAKLSITLKTLAKYRPTAEAIKEAWKKVGVETVIEEVEGKPDTFQVYLGDFVLPNDPDQYALWHSTSPSNITKFLNLRVDKLLEDGRRITNEKERITVYNDFQKYLLEDSPAAFLYFPYEYTVERR